MWDLLFFEIKLVILREKGERTMAGNKLNDEVVTEEQLVKEGYRKYQGKEIDIYYNSKACQHAGSCVRGNGAIYNVDRKPWILADAASSTENIRVVDSCPSGALKYIVKNAN